MYDFHVPACFCFLNSYKNKGELISSRFDFYSGIVTPEAFHFVEFKGAVRTDNHEIGRVGASAPKDQFDGLKLEFPYLSLSLEIGKVKSIGGLLWLESSCRPPFCVRADLRHDYIKLITVFPLEFVQHLVDSLGVFVPIHFVQKGT